MGRSASSQGPRSFASRSLSTSGPNALEPKPGSYRNSTDKGVGNIPDNIDNIQGNRQEEKVQ